MLRCVEKFQDQQITKYQGPLTTFISQTEHAVAHVTIPISCERIQLDAVNCKYRQIV